MRDTLSFVMALVVGLLALANTLVFVSWVALVTAGGPATLGVLVCGLMVTFTAAVLTQQATSPAEGECPF